MDGRLMRPQVNSQFSRTEVPPRDVRCIPCMTLSTLLLAAGAVVGAFLVLHTFARHKRDGDRMLDQYARLLDQSRSGDDGETPADSRGGRSSR
jgi:hypothetical protein